MKLSEKISQKSKDIFEKAMARKFSNGGDMLDLIKEEMERGNISAGEQALIIYQIFINAFSQGHAGERVTQNGQRGHNMAETQEAFEALCSYASGEKVVLPEWIKNELYIDRPEPNMFPKSALDEIEKLRQKNLGMDYA